MKSSRLSILSILVFLVSWNALIGSSNVAVLCMHVDGFIHLESEKHEEECCSDDKAEQSSDDLTTISQLADCGHCIDIELKGSDEPFSFRGLSSDVPLPTWTELPAVELFKQSPFLVRSIEVRPQVEASLVDNLVTRYCIKKTVLRL